MPYTIRQAAAARRVHHETIRRAIERGDLAADYTTDIHGQRVAQIAEEDLRNWRPRKRGRKPKGEPATDQ